MKLPQLKLKRPQLKRSTGKKPAVKPPKFVADVYADLRDRRLLPLVALLAVAIVAAPFLLAGDDREEAPVVTPAAASGAASASQASFAVVPAEARLRDYHRRLGDRQARNPFKQPVTVQATTADSSESSAEGAGGAPEVSTSGEGESEGPAKQHTTTKVVVQDKVLGYEIDTKAGFVGFVKPREGISPTTKLPSAKNPVIVFTGYSKDHKGALFLMSSNVTAYYGKARCALEKASCQLVELRPGKSATFAYGYGEARYKLALKRIVPVVSTHASEATVTPAAGGNGGAPAGK